MHGENVIASNVLRHACPGTAYDREPSSQRARPPLPTHPTACRTALPGRAQATCRGGCRNTTSSSALAPNLPERQRTARAVQILDEKPLTRSNTPPCAYRPSRSMQSSKLRWEIEPRNGRSNCSAPGREGTARRAVTTAD